AAHLGMLPSAIAPLLKTTREELGRYKDGNGVEHRMAYAWEIYGDFDGQPSTWYWKDGATGGFRTDVRFSVDEQWGIVLLTNAYDYRELAPGITSGLVGGTLEDTAVAIQRLVR